MTKFDREPVCIFCEGPINNDDGRTLFCSKSCRQGRIYEGLVAAGLCPGCGGAPEPGRILCPGCPSKARNYNKKSRSKQPWSPKEPSPESTTTVTSASSMPLATT